MTHSFPRVNPKREPARTRCLCEFPGTMLGAIVKRSDPPERVEGLATACPFAIAKAFGLDAATRPPEYCPSPAFGRNHIDSRGDAEAQRRAQSYSLYPGVPASLRKM